MKLRMFSLRKFVCVCFLLLLSLSMIGNFLPSMNVSEAKANSDITVNLETMFLNYFADWRLFFHSNFDRTEVWVNNWNLTSSFYSYANSRHQLGKYLYSLILAYELTNEEQYLSEAKWLMDLMMATQTGSGLQYDKTWNLYQQHPNADYGFFHLDSWIWLAWQKLNEYGMGNYDITEQITEVKDLAYYNNATHLAWEYYYYQQTGQLNNYIVNTFVPMLTLMSYLTNKSVSDYTSDMEKIYTATEDFRLDDDSYRYKMSDDFCDELYSVWVIWHQLLVQLWSPNIINTTKIQNTLDATTYSNLTGLHEEIVGAAIYPLAKGLGYTVPNPYYRAFERAWIVHNDDFPYKQLWQKVQTQSKAREDWWTLSLMVSLGVSAKEGYSVTLSTPSLTKSGNNYYFNNVFYNNTYLSSSASQLYMPMWTSSWLGSRLDGTSGAYLSEPFWNSALNAFTTNFTHGGDTFFWNVSRTEHWVNMSVANPRSWGLVVIDNQFDDYACKLIMKNGTVLSLSEENKTINLDSNVFAFEVRTSSTVGEWVLVKTNNSTITQTTFNANPSAVDLWIKSTVTYYKEYKIYNKYTNLGESDWITFESWISEMLTNLYNDDPLFNAEYSRNATQGHIIHSDANISNYNDQISSQNKLSFTLTYGSGETSNTVVYCGSRGKPDYIVGATSWSYNNKTRIATLNVLHSSSKEVVVYFSEDTPPTTTISLSGVSGNNNWFTSEVMVTLLAVDDISGVKKTEYSFDNDVWSIYNKSFMVSAEGNTIVHYRSMDEAGNLEEIHSHIIRKDETAPTGSIIINNDEAFTNSTAVRLTLSATDAVSNVSLVRFSNDGVWDSEAWYEWFTIEEPLIWDLSSVDGEKEVYYQVADNAGLVSQYVDDIILDTTNPTARAGENKTVNVNTTITFDASSSTDDLSGVVSYEWDFGDGNSATGVTVTHTYSKTETYTGALTVRDAAGNSATDSFVVTVIDSRVEGNGLEVWIVGVTVGIVVIGIAVITAFLRKRKTRIEYKT